MGNLLFKNIVRFIFLLIFQILVFSKMNIFGFINPFPYVLYILLFPSGDNKKMLLITSFIMGYTIDLFSDSGGVHALSSVVIAYMRSGIFEVFFGSSFESQTLDLRKNFSINVFKYMLFFVLIHHLLFFVVSVFSFVNILDILLRTLVTLVFTLSIVIMLFLFFKPKRL